MGALPAAVLLCVSAAGQGIITTIAGTKWVFPAEMPSLAAPLDLIFGIAPDSKGGLSIAAGSYVFFDAGDGRLRIIAGSGHGGSTPAGPIPAGQLNIFANFAVGALVRAPDDSLYLAYGWANGVYRITSDGMATLIAGGGWRYPDTYEGRPATEALFAAPSGMAFDNAGSLYLAIPDQNRVLRVSPEGILTTFAGGGPMVGLPPFSGDGGLATQAPLAAPIDVAVDAAGNVYIADYSHHRIRVVAPSGVITTYAGDGQSVNAGDGGPRSQASFGWPTSLAFDKLGNLFVGSDQGCVRRIARDGLVSTVAGQCGAVGFSGDGGPATSARLDRLYDLAVDANGNLLVSDTYNQRVRLVDSKGVIRTIAGNGGVYPNQEGNSALGLYLTPGALAVDANQAVFVADQQQWRTWRIDAQGVARTWDGNMMTGQLLVDSHGVLYAVGCGAPSGIPLKGYSCGEPGIYRYGGDGQRTKLPFIDKTGISIYGWLGLAAGLAVDSAGNFYTTLSVASSRILRIAPDGTATVYAGNGAQGYADGPALQASFGANTLGLAMGPDGSLFVSDWGNFRIRKISRDGIVTTIAGTGANASTGDGGPALAAAVQPLSVWVDRDGTLYFREPARVRKITPAGIITTIAGTGTPGSTGDGGLSTEARIDSANFVTPFVTTDASGALYFSGSSTVRKIVKAPVTFQVSPAALSLEAPSGSPAIYKTVNISASIAAVVFTLQTSGGDWLKASSTGGAAPASVDLTVDPSHLQPGVYQGTVTVTIPVATPPVQTVAVTLSVTPGGPARLESNTTRVDFALLQDSEPATSAVTLRNSGGSSLSFSASLDFGGGSAGWVAVTPSGGDLGAGQSTSLTVTASPAGFPPGTYSSTLKIESGGGSLAVPVLMTVRPARRTILLSQTGLTFVAVAGGGRPMPQSFGVLNTGVGSMSWTVESSTLSGGPWLSISPADSCTDGKWRKQAKGCLLRRSPVVN